MKTRALLFILILLCQNVIAQNKDTAAISITNYRLKAGTYSWRTTNTYFDRTSSWDSSPYTEGHLVHYNGTYRQNFRLLYPEGYDPNYAEGYPLMVVIHGAGERGNCWYKETGQECYFGTPTYDPNTEPVGATQEQIDNLLNNDHNLLHGGAQHLSARNRAGTLKPNDPSMPARAFPGFVLFPQMLNGWSTTEVRNAIRTVRLLAKELNIDEDRIYINGLSMGGRAVLNALVEADWLFAAAVTMSAVTSHEPFRTEADSAVHIPLWMFQGGQDTFPNPGATELTVNTFKAAGGNVRYTLYPTLGHGTWNTAYAEPDFFSWFLSKNKSDIHVYYGTPSICGTNGTGAKLTLAQGFPAYQWEHDGQIIPGATSYFYEAKEPGVYRARFSRVSSNPAAGEWNNWSKPVTIAEESPAKPVVAQVGSIVLNDLNGRNTARLQGPEGFASYRWYKNGEPTTLANTASVSITPGDCTGPCTNAGTYTLVTSGLNGCPSLPSDGKTVFFNNQAPVNIAKPTNFSATLNSPTEVLLRWNDVSGLERHYEIWRRKSTDPSSNGWTFVTLTNEDAILYLDTKLEANTIYWYKLRAVSNNGRSDYAPGNSKVTEADNVIISTGMDNVPPTPPQNLTATLVNTDIATKLNTIELKWSASTDNSAVKEYRIRYGSTTVTVTPDQTTHLLTALPLNNEYNFTVAAVDLSGNLSAPSNQANARTYIDGFFWEHSTGAFRDIRDVPATTWASPEYKGKSANLTLEPRTQEDFFVFKYYGYISITTAGQYLFRVRSNDGVQMWIDGTLVLRRNGMVGDGICATTNFTSGVPAVSLSPGPHSIELRYFQYTGDKCLSLQWQGPDAGPNPTRFYDVPDTRIRSYEGYTPPVLPDVPQNLLAVSAGMKQINLSWEYAGEYKPEFEIQRSASAQGPFTIVNRVATLACSDTSLAPATTYYYKVRSVDEGGMSEFTPVVSATTDADSEPPTPPASLVLYSKTITTASIGWTKSEDNTGVTSYEIYTNDVLTATTQQSYYLLEDLEPFSTYNVYVVALDANQNRSQPSNLISFETSEPLTYFSKATGDLTDLATWGTEADGTGTSPSTFAINGLFLNITNRASASVNAPWTIEGDASRIIVNSGVTLTVTGNVSGKLDVHDGATVILNSATTIQFSDVSPGSTIQYNQNALNVTTGTYGNLILNGTGSKTFASGTTTISGNMTVSNGLAIRGAAGNRSQIVLSGNLTLTGTRAMVTPDATIGLTLNGMSRQTISSGGNVELAQLVINGVTPELLTPAGPITVRLGGTGMGGLVLPEGRSLMLGPNTLSIVAGGAMNPSGETGFISVSNGTIEVATTSNRNSNLYFDPTSNQLSRLHVNSSGTGQTIVRSAVDILAGVKVTDGTLNGNGNVRLISTPTFTANLETIENNGRVTGEMLVQRYINGKEKTYRYLSAPVQGITVESLQKYFPVTGDFEGSSSDPDMGSAPSMFTYREPSWIAYPSTSNQAPLQKGIGYSVYIKDGQDFTMENQGVPFQGTVVYELTPPTDNTGNTGWNLIGNPYPSTIKWSTDAQAWTRARVSSVVAVRENMSATSGRFLYYDAATGLGTGTGGVLAGGKIAQGQSFYVRTTGANPSLTITERAKTTEQQTLYRESSSDVGHFKIALHQGDLVDETIVVFTDFATDQYDPSFDGLKQRNEGMFNLASLSADGHPLAINNTDNRFCHKEVWLTIGDVKPGNYTLKTSTVELPAAGQVVLHDRFLGSSVNLLNEESYSFSVTEDPSSFGSERFVIRVERPELPEKLTGAAQAQCGLGGSIRITQAIAGATYELSAGGNVLQSYISERDEIEFSIDKSALNKGRNEFIVSASFAGCDQNRVSTPFPMDYEDAPVALASDVSVCSGEAATLSAAISDGHRISWYDETGNVIKGQDAGTLVTEPVVKETFYYVSATTQHGCEGPKATITVTPAQLENPQLLFDGNTLQSSVVADSYEWKLNGEVIAETLTPYFTPVENGEYSLQVVSGGCTKASASFVVTGLENTEGGSLSVYPNPTKTDAIHIKGSVRGDGAANIRIIDVAGREIFRAEVLLDNLNSGIRIQPGIRLEPGIYVLVLEKKSQIWKKRFVIHL
jgi:hypothetical protein